MKKKLPLIGIFFILILGIAVLSYPLFSSVVNNIASRNMAEEYKVTTAEMSDHSKDALFEAADKYNKSLSNSVIITDPFDEAAYQKIGEFYKDTLDVNGAGLIGYVDIPKINVYLPINHGTSSEILAHGAGHLQNTSLPIGGDSTHSVISAHSAYPGETFFDYLTDLKEGDEFYIHVLNRTLKYEIDNVKIVLPENIDDLRIIKGGDYVTLLTCTPYSINTHRLLVRGKRVEYDDTKYITTGSSIASFQDYLYFLGYKIPYWVAGLVIGLVIAAIIFVIVFSVVKTRQRKNCSANHLKDSEKSSDKTEDTK